MTDDKIARKDAPRIGCILAMMIPFVAPLGFCAAYRYADARSRLSPDLEIAEVLAFVDQSGFGDACVFGAYRLTSKGIASIPASDATDKTPLRLDKKGNLPDGTHLYATGAAGGCGIRPSTPSPWPALSQPGSYYGISAGGEELIVTDPKHGLAWYLYFG